MNPGKDHIGSSAFVLIFNQQNEVLLVNHKMSEKKTEEFSNCWAMPGGTVEFGETVISALKREIKEELDIEIYDEELLGHHNWIKENKHWIALNFIAKTKGIPKIMEPEKMSEIKFFKLDKLPTKLSIFCEEYLKKIKERKTIFS